MQRHEHPCISKDTMTQLCALHSHQMSIALSRLQLAQFGCGIQIFAKRLPCPSKSVVVAGFYLLRFRRTGDTLSASKDHTIGVLDAYTGKALVAPLQGHTDEISSMAILAISLSPVHLTRQFGCRMQSLALEKRQASSNCSHLAR